MSHDQISTQRTKYFQYLGRHICLAHRFPIMTEIFQKLSCRQVSTCLCAEGFKHNTIVWSKRLRSYLVDKFPHVRCSRICLIKRIFSVFGSFCCNCGTETPQKLNIAQNHWHQNILHFHDGDNFTTCHCLINICTNGCFPSLGRHIFIKYIIQTTFSFLSSLCLVHWGISWSEWWWWWGCNDDDNGQYD